MKDPPKSYERTYFKIDGEEVEALHWRLDALLNGRKRIMRLADPDFDAHRDVIRRNRIDLVRQAAALIGDVCGDWIKISENDSEDALAGIALALRIWQPALAMHDEFDVFWDLVIDEIGRMRFGDQPDIIKPSSRPPGSHRQPANLTFKRLTALQWAAYLKSRGVRAGGAHRAISLAYGADWDAIRKWKNSASRIFGADFVNGKIADASEGFGLQFGFPSYYRPLHSYGQSYREVAGIGEIEFSAFHTVLVGKSRA